MTIRDLTRKQIKEIAETYANCDVSRGFFTKKYGISDSTFYNSLNKAVIEHLVSLDTVEKMRQRAIHNVRTKLEDDTLGNESQLHYDELLEKRKNFMFTKTVRIALLKKFVNSELSMKEFCRTQEISLYLFQKIMIQAIVHEEISKRLSSQVKSILVENCNDVTKMMDVLFILEDTNSKKFEINVLHKQINAILTKTNDTSPSLFDTLPTSNVNEDGYIPDDGYAILDED